MILNALTLFHVVLSLIGVASGVVAILPVVKSEGARSMNAGFPCDDGGNKHYRFLVPVSRRHACPGPRRAFFDRVDYREPFVLSLPSPGDLASDLCNHRRDGALLQRVRSGRSTFSAGAGSERDCPDLVGAAFPDSAARRAAAVCGDWNSRRDLKAATRACPLIHYSKEN